MGLKEFSLFVDAYMHANRISLKQAYDSCCEMLRHEPDGGFDAVKRFMFAYNKEYGGQDIEISQE